MKKIYICAMLCFSAAAHGATTPLGNTIAEYRDAPQYLVQAADAWDSLIGTPMRGGAIAARMSAMNDAHNGAKTFVLNAHGVGGTDKFEHHKNDDFEMRTGGAGVSAYAYVTDGLAFGVGYTYAKSKTHDMPLKADGASDIISLFTKYMGENGWYMNIALAAGQTQWDLDKTVAGVANKTSFDTDLYSGQITTGMVLGRGRLTLAPEISTRYTRLINEKHVDAAAQDFKKWWYNTLSVDAGASVGLTFALGGMVVRPTVKVGAGYEIIHNGTDKVATRLITNQHYDMPVHAPNRTELRAGGGVGLYGGKIAAEAAYTLHSRSDYTAHDVHATVKIAF